jgi:hypothetical protein
LAREDEPTISGTNYNSSTKSTELFNIDSVNGENLTVSDEDIRKTLTDLFIDNAQLRKELNSVSRCALKSVAKSDREETEEVPLRKTVLNRFLSS